MTSKAARHRGTSEQMAAAALGGERLASAPDSLAAPAIPIDDVAGVLKLPLSTLEKLRSRGEGPRFFLIGRRLYTRPKDLREWIDRLAGEPS